MGSNIVALPIDSIIFGIVAFAGIQSAGEIMDVINGQFLFKMAVTIGSLPLIYMTPGEKHKLDVDAVPAAVKWHDGIRSSAP